MAVQIQRLGAEEVTLVYRRGFDAMSATNTNSTSPRKIRSACAPGPSRSKCCSMRGPVRGMRFEKTPCREPPGRHRRTFEIAADAIFKAIGQSMDETSISDPLAKTLKRDGDKIAVDDQFRTVLPRIYAGGDCVAPGQDLTVQAVQHGKLAAHAIHADSTTEGGCIMADLSIEFCGIKSINPFWLASAPPTDKAYNVVRAFEAGWGGVVWKTLGEDPAAVNVSSRYSAHYGKNREVLGFNNIELITDRSLEINLQEITQVKKDWPDRVIIVSLMLP
jgi:hypothetical protein